MGSKKDQIRVEMRIEFGKLSERLSQQVDNAQSALDIQVLKDCDPYIPMDTGNLRNSGLRATTPGDGKVIWDAVYAWAQYNGLARKSHDVHPLATLRWFEAAKQVKGEAWVRIAKKIGGKR